jgi:hypothetical protein
MPKFSNHTTRAAPTPVRRVVSGGQTGVDRAALDVAIELGLDHGGWCPAGRRAEDGPIDERYRLKETDSAEYAVRTERNVLDSDATLIICPGEPTGGTVLTRRLARRHAKPVLVVSPTVGGAAQAARKWLIDGAVEVLNVAGPRESSSPGFGKLARAFLARVLRVKRAQRRQGAKTKREATTRRGTRGTK